VEEMMKRLAMALGLVLLIGLTATALDKADYRVYFVTESGAVIAGITETGRLDTLLGALSLDGVATTFGTGSDTSLLWSQTDPNAGCFLIDLPAGSATSVPYVVIASADSNFGYFDGLLEPHLAVENLAGTGYVMLGHSATTLAELKTGGADTQLTITSPILVNTGSTSITDYTPSRIIGYDAGAAMTIAVTDTTGAVGITHAGDNKKVTWTTTGGFDFAGAFETDELTLSADIDVKGGNIKNTTVATGLSLDATAAAAGTGTNWVTITGTSPVHAGGNTTSRWLDINPTFGINTAAANFNLIDLTFTTQAWAQAVASNLNAIYIAPTIGNASAGTNQVNLIEIANITGDASVNVTGLAIGTNDGAGTANAITVGAGWDAGISNASSYTSTSTLSAEDLTSTDDGDVNDTLTVGDLVIDEAIGTLAFTAATSATISTATAGVGIAVDALDAAAGSNMNYFTISGSVPIHAANTPTTSFLDINPTVAVPTVTSTVNLIDLALATPAYATGGAVGTYRGIWIDPAIGAATNGTNTVALIDFDIITGDDTVSLYGIRAGALTGTASVENFISIGAGWDNGIDSASPVKSTTFIVDDGDADLTVDSDNQTSASATINVPDFTDATADFLVTNIFTTVLPFAGGLRGEDTDAAGTNGGGLVGGAPDITTHTYTNATDDVFVLVYDAGTTTWDELATAALLNGGADWAANWQLQPDADAEAAGDAFAIGFSTPFCEVVFDDLATAAGALATYAADCGKYQYSTGAGTWSDLTVFDNTDVTAYDGKRTLQRTGAITFVPPANWVTATYDGLTKYWIQWVVTDAQLTQTALIDATNKDEPFIAVPNADTFSAPYKLEIAKVRVTDMGLTVHDQAIVFIVGNFTDGVFSAAQTWTASQLNDKSTLATAIAADPGDLIGICVTNDTGSTVNPIWAVEFEVTYED
jgi:hypothetical protein